MPLIYGPVSPSAFGVDDVYVAVQPPQTVIAGGGATFQGAAVGGATWGPKNSPQLCGTVAELIRTFGPPANSGCDLVQEGVLFLNQQPQGGFIGVRVAHAGADAAATATLVDSSSAPALIATAKYTGSFGNQIQILVGPGSNYQSSAKTWKCVIQPGTQNPEVFDRIPDGASGGTWQNIMNAVNNGQSNVAPPSQYVVLSLPGSPSVLDPSTTGNQVVTLSGGADGSSSLTAADLLGVNGSAGSRTGMYALDSAGADVIWLCGVGGSSSANYSALTSFAQAQSALAIMCFPGGTSVSTAIANKLSAGLDSPFAAIFKDLVTYQDSYLGQQVTINPCPVAAGICCRMSPEQSPGNQQAYGIIGTEATLSPNPQPYSFSDLSSLEQVGINLITIPIPSANAFGMRHGKTTSSNFATSEITYARKTNDLVRAFNTTVMGQFVNKLQSTQPNDPLREAVVSALTGYLAPQVANNQIDSFIVTCDLTNNTPATIAAGFLYASVTVKYLAVVDKFVIKLTAGQTVSTVSTGPQAA